MDYRIISIGALSRHELWESPGPVGTPHATTTLIRSGDKTILVDPGLPAPAVVARLGERAGLAPEDITDVFLTCFRPAHRGGIAAFEHARWWIAEAEREQVGRALVGQFESIPEDAADERELLRSEVALLQRCQPAPDKLADRVDLFPLPGFTPGNAGLLLLDSSRTTLLAGDAVATSEHLERGRVLRGAFDAEQAKDSLAEAIEIADALIPGHDNVVLNPTRAGGPALGAGLALG
ncbi:MAG: MBL fold metallo-hydrolase [Planctomycetota bacterium]